MKYIVENLIIPQDKRAEINNKILYLIDNGIAEENGITATDIASSYTGNGGLSGEKFSNYENYYDYSEAKKEFEQGQFFTPYAITDFVIQCLKPDKFDIIMDLTCGHGAFANSVPQESNFFGCEIDMKSYKVAKYLYPKANIRCSDIRVYNPEIRADVIVGNPPFNLKWQIGDTTYVSQLYYTIKASENIKPGGLMALVVPSSFLADDFSDRGMIEEVSKEWNLLCQFDIPSDTFKNLGVTNFSTKIMFFQKKSEHILDVKFSTKKIAIDCLNIESSNFIYENYIKPVITLRNKLKNQLFFENLHDGKTQEQKQFEYKVKKMMFDIKRNPALLDKYAKCSEYLYKYQTQKMPEGMKYEEWEKRKITPNKVLAYLRKVIKSEHKVEIDKIELVKTDYGLKLKPYSRKMKILLNKQYGDFGKFVSINDIVSGQCSYQFENKKYEKLIDKKIKDFQSNEVSFKDMKQDSNIMKFLDNFSIHDYNKNETYKLTEKQKEDINKLLQKRYVFLQWEQGSGKTFAGIAQMDYRFQHNNIRNAFVISTAIAINNNWQDCLEAYHYDYIRINSYSDIQKIKKGQIVLITLDILNTLQKHIKKFVKMQSQKVMLVMDESDSISNQNSKRTKAVLSCFRKIKYKVCMTGTSTRNNICEIYPQLELLYNNSVNMLCECETVYVVDKNKDSETKGKIISDFNEQYNNPFPAYKKGYSLFSKCFLPDKITVFGVVKKTQDIYNSEALKKLLDKTIITRKFEEVTGKKIYEIKNVTCKFTPEEEALYSIAIEEFYKMQYLFKTTGNSRKDAMLRILNQLTLLLKICACPHTFKEYSSTELSSKYKKVFEMIEKWNNERIVIGVRHVDNVYSYATAIKELYPNRPLFVITGNNTTLKKRISICNELKKTRNGILICTQQSLSCSMNIDFVNKCIIPELHWNNASMSQFYFRFIRFTSTEWKEIYFVTYENSIEGNLLKMILCKEKLNLFMKSEKVEDDDLYNKFGINEMMLKALMTKGKDEKGNIKILWGHQKITEV